jgi:HEAT repeat protein
MARLLALYLAIACGLAVTASYAEDEAPKPFGDYDEVIRDLMPQLAKDAASAQDAAYKLSKLGRRAVPVLQELLQRNQNAREPKGESANDHRAVAAYQQSRQIVYYCTLALSRIKHADAAKALIPFLKNDKAPVELRTMAVEALGMELLEEGGAALVEVATKDDDLNIQHKALIQLSVMPNFWVASEKLFVDALSSPDDDIRTLAAKQCYFARVYLSAAPKLIELAQKDSNPNVRTQAMLALGRMRIQKAVPPLVAMLADETAGERDRDLALRTVVTITGIGFKDAASVSGWWTRQGEKEFARQAEVEAAASNAATQQADSRPPQLTAPAPDPASPRQP